jgi:CPA2 family monovalent cation:H+ antiporter-2/glutathione-regulated potassium-efflux system protein KefB
LLLKAGILLGLAKAFRLSMRDGWLTAVSLSQVGEFAVVLLGVAGMSGLLNSETGKLFEGITALTMAMTPLLLALYEKTVLPRFSQRASNREADAVSGHAPVIIAGFGRVGNMIGRLLRANGVATHVLDVDPNLIDMVRRIGLQAYYGDASRLDLLKTAGAAEAKLLILALNDPEKTLEICETARKHFPHLRILARAQGREDAYQLVNMGLTSVHRETFGTALEMGEEALRSLGFRAHHSHRIIRLFRKKNETDFREMAAHFGKKTFFVTLREKISATEEQMRRFSPGSMDSDQAFENAVLREERKKEEAQRSSEV